MGDKSAIEWTDATWNPIRARNAVFLTNASVKHKVGWHCTHVSEGCRYCYAESINKRLGTGLDYKPGHEKDIDIFLDEKTLLAPLRWKRPRMIFVCSMTDLFADFVTDAWIDQMFAVVAMCPQHSFQILTKRAKRMRDYFARIAAEQNAAGEDTAYAPRRYEEPACRLSRSPCAAGLIEDCPWPMPNVWLGVSAEDQEAWDERVMHLCATPARIRFVSVEPLLGPIDCGNAFDPPPEGSTFNPIDWVITGGESGPKARGTMRYRFRSMRDQCAAAGAAYFHKQNGEWIDADEWLGVVNSSHLCRLLEADLVTPWSPPRPLNFLNAAILAKAYGCRFEHQSDGSTLIRVGKKRAGRLLDGVEHSAMPEVRT